VNTSMVSATIYAPQLERRRVQRVKLPEPIRGTCGATRIYIADISLSGMRVVHQDPIGKIGEDVTIRFDWDARPILLACRIVRSLVQSSDPRGKQLVHSGLAIVHASTAATGSLRDLVESHVARALDEQKANARGLPAVAPASFQTGRASRFLRHELVLGRWRETETTDPLQPEHGFTVSVDHTKHEIEMLRSAFERGSGKEGRDLIRRLAQLSIGNREGIPTRRFTP
jgi:hypothetical protein